MATRKDMRRADLIVPYREPEKAKNSNEDTQSMMASTLPMAAIFTRNKMIGWTAVMFAVQGWLSETEATRATSSTPAWMSIGMAILALGVAYMPLFMPPPLQAQTAGSASGTQAPPPVPS